MGRPAPSLHRESTDSLIMITRDLYVITPRYLRYCVLHVGKCSISFGLKPVQCASNLPIIRQLNMPKAYSEDGGELCGCMK